MILELILIYLLSSLIVIKHALGDPDENVFVLQSGKVNVFINSNDGSSISLKVVKAGESITSLLSFTDVLTVITFYFIRFNNIFYGSTI